MIPKQKDSKFCWKSERGYFDTSGIFLNIPKIIFLCNQHYVVKLFHSDETEYIDRKKNGSISFSFQLVLISSPILRAAAHKLEFQGSYL